MRIKIVILTHWGRVTHICVGKLTIIGSDNGSSPGRRQAIIWTNVGMLLIGPLGTNFSEMLIKIYTFSFKKMHLKMSSGKRRPFCLGLNVLNIFCDDKCLSQASLKNHSCHNSYIPTVCIFTGNFRYEVKHFNRSYTDTFDIMTFTAAITNKEMSQDVEFPF